MSDSISLSLEEAVTLLSFEFLLKEDVAESLRIVILRSSRRAFQEEPNELHMVIKHGAKDEKQQQYQQSESKYNWKTECHTTKQNRILSQKVVDRRTEN